jgi:hypothetical protein
LEKSWLKKRNARTHRVRVRSRQTASIVALPVKAPATPLNWIAIAVTKPAREISKEKLSHEKAQAVQKGLAD